MWKIFAGLLIAGGLVGLAGAVFKSVMDKDEDEPIFAEAAEPCQARNAEVKSMQPVKITTGDVIIPGHRVAYMVLFSLESGEELLLEVDEDQFDILLVGDKGLLITQNKKFVGFDKDLGVAE